VNLVIAPARKADVEQLFRPDIDIPVESLSLLRRSDVDDRVLSTALTGTLRYPGQPRLGRIAIDTGETVALAGLSVLRLTALWVDPKKPGIGMRVRGLATKVRTGSEDRRLSYFDRSLGRASLVLPGLLVAGAFQWAWLRAFGARLRRR
jgi:hypothetical protein